MFIITHESIQLQLQIFAQNLILLNANQYITYMEYMEFDSHWTVRALTLY